MARPRGVSQAMRLMLVGIAIVWSAFPIALVVTSSFKEASQIFEVPPRLLFTPTLDNYRVLWGERPEFFRALSSSLAITAGATAVTLVAATLAGYVYARFRSRFLSTSAFGLLAVRMLPPIIVTVPLFPVLNVLRMNDTHLSLVLLYAAFYVSLGTWIMRSFVAQLPVELEEAAAVDGAGRVRTLVSVTAPLLAPGIVATGLFAFVTAWNEFFFALVLLKTPEKQTLPVVLTHFIGAEGVADLGPLAAAACLATLPSLVVFALIQRRITGSLLTGAVKS